jgi:hypothetical protein
MVDRLSYSASEMGTYSMIRPRLVFPFSPSPGKDLLYQYNIYFFSPALKEEKNTLCYKQLLLIICINQRKL